MKISFVDFWDGFTDNNNLIYHLIKSVRPDVIITNPQDCDILIFSCFGSKNSLYLNKKRIFFTGENIRPNFDSEIPQLNDLFGNHYYINKCDFSLSFDFINDDRNIRLPLWLYQIDFFNVKTYNNPEYLIPIDHIDNNDLYKKDKNKFCSIVFNNPSPFRWEFIEKMSKYKTVDYYGHIHNKSVYGEWNKLNLISDYKFNVCFENSLHPGYYTEKPLHAKISGCVPIYWAGDGLENDFNRNSFIMLNDFNNIDNLIEYIIELDKNDDEFYKKRNLSTFKYENYHIDMFNNIKSQINKILN